MKAKAAAPKHIDDYIARFPEDIRNRLEKLRLVIRKGAPKAEEVISYGMPAFRQKGILVYFAAFKEHISFFPTSSGTAKFKRELAAYDCSKGTVRFPMDRAIPMGLIGKIVKFRVKENTEKATAKRKMS